MAFFLVLIILLLLCTLIIDANISEKKQVFLKNNLDYITIDDQAKLGKSHVEKCWIIKIYLKDFSANFCLVLHLNLSYLVS